MSGPVEGEGNAVEKKLPATVQADGQPPEEADQTASDSLSAEPEDPPSPKTPERSSEASATSRGSSLSPQPSMQLHADVSHWQLGPDLPGPAAQAAQAADPAAHEEEPWQEVRTSRRKPASQQTASKASMNKAPKQGRDAPNRHTPAASHSPPGELQTAALQAVQAPLIFDKPTAPLNSTSQHKASEKVPGSLSASARSNPQPSTRQSSQKYMPPLQHSQDNPVRMQHQPFQATSNNAISTKASAAPQQAQHPGLHCGATSCAQVCMLALDIVTISTSGKFAPSG